MGKGSEWIATSENNSLGSCEAHHVGISPQENCGGTAGEVGERISPRTIRRQNESDSLSQGAEVDLSSKSVVMLMEQWRKNSEMHIYHYAPYEPTAIKRLVGRHGTCVDEVDELLRAGVFVDLYRAVRQGIRASVESYSIKRLEPLYGFTRAVPLRDANLALQSFEAADRRAEASVLLRGHRRSTVPVCRAVGAMEEPERRMGQVVFDSDDISECSHVISSRPNACHS